MRCDATTLRRLFGLKILEVDLKPTVQETPMTKCSETVASMAFGSASYDAAAASST